MPYKKINGAWEWVEEEEAPPPDFPGPGGFYAQSKSDAETLDLNLLTANLDRIEQIRNWRDRNRAVGQPPQDPTPTREARQQTVSQMPEDYWIDELPLHLQDRAVSDLDFRNEYGIPTKMPIPPKEVTDVIRGRVAASQPYMPKVRAHPGIVETEDERMERLIQTGRMMAPAKKKKPSKKRKKRKTL